MSLKANSKCFASTSLLKGHPEKMSMREKGATPSNCGKALKLQLLTHRGNTGEGRGNDLGYSKNVEDDHANSACKIGNPQPSPSFSKRGAVHRLNVGGSLSGGLRYSRSLSESFESQRNLPRNRVRESCGYPSIQRGGINVLLRYGSPYSL